MVTKRRYKRSLLVRPVDRGLSLTLVELKGRKPVRKVIIGQKLTNQALAMPRPSCKLPRRLVRVRGGFGITSATTVRPGYLGGCRCPQCGNWRMGDLMPKPRPS